MTNKMQWVIPVCRTCHRQAIWPFCEHRMDEGSGGGNWYALVTVTGPVPPPPGPRLTG